MSAELFETGCVGGCSDGDGYDEISAHVSVRKA